MKSKMGKRQKHTNKVQLLAAAFGIAWLSFTYIFLPDSLGEKTIAGPFVSSSIPAAELVVEGHAVQLPVPTAARHLPANPASHALHSTPSDVPQNHTTRVAESLAGSQMELPTTPSCWIGEDSVVFTGVCVDGFGTFFTRGPVANCSAWIRSSRKRNPWFYQTSLPARINMHLSGKGLILDCWRSSGNPAHSFMAVSQLISGKAKLGADWSSVQWIAVRGCGFEKPLFYQSAILQALHSVLGDAKLPIVHLPLRADFVVCFDEVILIPERWNLNPEPRTLDPGP